MPQKLTDIKIEILKRDRKNRDLAEYLGISYSRLCGILGGFQREPDRFRTTVWKVFKQWDVENDSIARMKKKRCHLSSS